MSKFDNVANFTTDAKPADFGIVYEQHNGWHTLVTPKWPGVFVSSRDRAKAFANVLPSLAKLVELDTRAEADGDPLSDEQIDAIAEAMPGGLDGFLTGWGWRQFARAVEDAIWSAPRRPRIAASGNDAEARCYDKESA